MDPVIQQQTICYHCGEPCDRGVIRAFEHDFCCEGCRIVFQLLNQHGLCDYYALNESPGANLKKPVRQDKFAFLADEQIAARLIDFRDDHQTRITLYLPQIHCSSCLYLLEQLHKLNTGIISSKIDFARKEITVVFRHAVISLPELATLLTRIGYEPYISLADAGKTRPKSDKLLVYQLGVAGFCFANIMLLSFPEYLGLAKDEISLRSAFRFLNLSLSLPVLLFSARPFFESAWKSLKSRFLNIDAPIALAIGITFGRSVYEVLSSTGAGYFDSMSGIVFFMLAGRLLQDRTYRQLSFERDYTAYFPVAVTVIRSGQEVAVALPDIKTGDTLLIHHDELIPVDGILTRGKAYIDYSFVTGESMPVTKEMGEIVYAGGRQTGANMEILSIREVSQSYLTSLWNQDQGKQTEEKKSFVHLISRYFTIGVLLVAAGAAAYWSVHDPARIWPAVTAVMIVACPCALLLSSSFTNGNILRILSRNRFYLRNAQTIENLAMIDQVVFDKTGTLTQSEEQDMVYEGPGLTGEQQDMIALLASQSIHPLSVALAGRLSGTNGGQPEGFEEIQGQGLRASINGHLVQLGSSLFVTGIRSAIRQETAVYLSIDGKFLGRFVFRNHYRERLAALIRWMKPRYGLSVLSGDHEGERENLVHLFGPHTEILFRQMPKDKLDYIRHLQQQGKKVMMIGDGLNDAVALKQSDVGIALSGNANNFTPASDAILEAAQLVRLPGFIRLCRANKKIIWASFVLSVVYNVVGLYFAVQGNLSPLIAAILMPSSSLSILLITFGSSNLLAKWLRL